MTSLTKRKIEGLIGDSTNPRLQEFLSVMQPPSKSKIWANEDSITTVTTLALTEDNAKVESELTQSDDQYEPVPKKRKRSPSVSTEKEIIVPNTSTEYTSQNSKAHGAEPEPINSGTEKETTHVLVMGAAPSSDADWLRSRTSRLLDLVDDVEGVEPNGPSVVASNARPQSPSAVQMNAIRQMPDAGSQMYAESAEGARVPTTHDEHIADQNIATGRLFLRNLSYTTSEDELRQHFAKYGIVSEVSATLVLFNLICSKCIL